MFFRCTSLPIIITILISQALTLKAEGPLATPGQQVLLLRNGQAVAGQISRVDNIYQVILPDGLLRVKAADVEFVCRDLEEAYQLKRAAIPPGSLSDHIALSQWCQRHKLYDHAAAELAQAAAIEPKNPLVGSLQRRLQMTLAPPPDPPKREISPNGSPSNDELDRMMRSLPHKAMENFSQSVQPLLINNCTSSGCHGPQSENSFRLERVSLGQPVGRRTTQRNLYAVLQYVDRANPLSSKILTAAAAPHGTVKTAIFTEYQASQYNRLADWLRQFGPPPQEPIPTNLANDPPTSEDSSATRPNVMMPRILSPNVRTARTTASMLHSGAAVGPFNSSWMENPAALGAAADLPGSAPNEKSAVSNDIKADQASYQEPKTDSPQTPKKTNSAAASRSKIKRGVTLSKLLLDTIRPEKAATESAQPIEK